MSRIDPKSSIKLIPLMKYNYLISELMKDDAWKIMVQWLENKFPGRWEKNIDSEIRRVCDKNPVEILLFEMQIRLCRVCDLWKVLKECNLLDALTIIHPPEPLIITKQPNVNGDTQQLPFRDEFSISCKAFSLPPPEYQWYLDNEEIPGETSPDLSFLVANAMQEGSYYCQIRKRNCDKELVEEQSTEAVELVIQPTPITIITQPALFVEIPAEGELLVECLAESHPPPVYQWYWKNEVLKNQTSNVLKVNNFCRKQRGRYRCHVSNRLSEVITRECSVILKEPRQTATAKIALLIGNCQYKHQELLFAPKTDLQKIAEKLIKMKFVVTCMEDLERDEMIAAITIFCDELKNGVYGFFYFAGHGFSMDQEYMMPINIPEEYLREHAISVRSMLDQSQENKPRLRVFIYDMCLTMPERGKNPKIYNESSPLVSQKDMDNGPKNLVVQYATSENRLSYEARNGAYYAKFLLQHIDEDAEPVDVMLRRVAESFAHIPSTKNRIIQRQAPKLSSNIVKNFRLTDQIVEEKKPAQVRQIGYVTSAV